MGCVYLARCKVNGKGYIGKSKHGIECRKKWHQDAAFNGAPYLFHRAIRKHGWDSFEWTILYEDDDDDREWLGWWEQKFIRQLNTKMPNGYNMTDGGDGGAWEFTDEQKQKISEALSGVPKSREHIEKMIRTQTGRTYEDIHGEEKAREIKERKRMSMIGKTHTLEARKKMSDAVKGKNKGKPSYKKGRTFEEIYGEERAVEIRKKLSISHRRCNSNV